MTAGEPWTAGLEGDTVDRFFDGFVLPASLRAGIPQDAAGTGAGFLPSGKQDVMRDLREIWASRGFLTPAETQAALIDKYLPQTEKTVRDFIRDICLSRNKADPATGCLTKEHAYLATGLGHLYARQTGMPMTMIEVDFSNMGGTNAHFRRLLADEEGGALLDVPEKQAEALTDRAMHLLAAGMVADIAALYPEERIVPIRTGGDELRFLVTGISSLQEQHDLSNLLHANIERRVAAMGLQDHPHMKAPDDARRNGFGAAMAFQNMEHVGRPGRLIQELDARISEVKNQLGLMRLGLIDHEAVAAEVEGKLRFGMISTPRGVSPEDIVDFHVARAQDHAQAAAGVLRLLNPAHNKALRGGVAGFEAYVDAALASLTPYAIAEASLPPVLAKGDFWGEGRPDGVSPADGLERRYVAVALEHFSAKGIFLPPAALYFLKQSVRGMIPEDPAAQVMMPPGMVRMLDAAAADAPDFRAQVEEDDPDVVAALARAGLKDVRQTAPQALVIVLYNLSGLNHALGHHNADVILRHVAHEVIGGAVHAAGVPREARSRFSVAHYGGGTFVVLLPAGGTDAQGRPWFSSPATVHRVRREMKERIALLNKEEIVPFLRKHGGYVDFFVKRGLEKSGLTAFSDIRHPKERRAIFGNTSVTGRVDGIHVVVTGGSVCYNPSAPGIGGNVFISTLRARAEAMMQHLLGAILYHAHKAGAEPDSAMAAPPPFSRTFNRYAPGSSTGAAEFVLEPSLKRGGGHLSPAAVRRPLKPGKPGGVP